MNLANMEQSAYVSKYEYKDKDKAIPVQAMETLRVARG
jgi:hypothetical protein